MLEAVFFVIFRTFLFVNVGYFIAKVIASLLAQLGFADSISRFSFWFSWQISICFLIVTTPPFTSALGLTSSEIFQQSELTLKIIYAAFLLLLGYLSGLIFPQVLKPIVQLYDDNFASKNIGAHTTDEVAPNSIRWVSIGLTLGVAMCVLKNWS